MKFARYLDENTVPEWRKVYIQYRGLKRLIKQVAAHREARLRLEKELGLSRTNSSSTPFAKSPNTPIDPALRRRAQQPSSTSTSTSADAEHQTHDGSASATGYSRRFDYASSATPALALPPLPPVSLEGTGLRLETDPLPSTGIQIPPKKPSAAPPTPDLEAQSRATNANVNVPQPSAARRNFGPSINTNVTFDASASHKQQHAPDSNDAPSLSPITPFTPFTAAMSPRTPSALRFFDRANPSPRRDAHPQRRLTRSATVHSLRSFKDDPPKTLAELIATCFDDQEAKVFSACNAELDRIVAFYEAQEQQAANKYAMLTRQLKELAEHRREYRAKYNINSQDRTMPAASSKNRVSQIFNSPVTKMIESGADEVAYRIKSVLGEQHNNAAADHAKPRNESSDNDVGDKRRAQALAQMQASLKGWDDETDQAVRQANKAAAMSHDPEAYNAARKKLKAAVLEYYKFLDTLTNYKILNRTGFAKVMKKLSKTVGVPCADLYYQDKVAPTILVTSDRIEKLRKATEDIYAAYFEHGNRKQALDRLRAREDHTTHHYSVFRSGLYLGVSLCAIVDGLIEAMKPETKRAIPQGASILRVYGAEFIPTLFTLLFGLNLAWWHAVRINTVFIFEWDVRTVMDYRQFFEIPALLMLCLSFCFWASFNSDAFPDKIAPTTWPTVWIVVAVVIMLNPFNLFMPSGRWWFTKSLLRVFSAGYKRVEFRDFFLGDELNSVAWTISNFWYIGCQYKHNWAYPDQCKPNNTYWTAVLLSVPAWLRLGQCIRRWVDSDYKTHLHLVNAGKYTSAVVNNFIYIHWRRNGSLHGRDKALWIFFASVYSVWHIGWDLVMDWSLLKSRAKYFLLRQEISFPQPVYYLFMLVDVIGRSVWIIYLFPGPASATLRSFLAALTEMLRRACWNMLRVENEQIGNTDSFKIMRDLPLPYRQKLREDIEAEPPKSSAGGGVFANRKWASLFGVGSKTPPALGVDAAHVGLHGSLGHIPTPEPAGTGAGAGAAKKRRRSLLESLRTKLVPDAGGTQYEGKRLDERAVTKGQSGRDYVPRQPQGAAAFVDRDSDEEDEDEGKEISRDGRGMGTGTESNSNSNDESSPKRYPAPLPPLSASPERRASVEVKVSQDADEDARQHRERQREAEGEV